MKNHLFRALFLSFALLITCFTVSGQGAPQAPPGEKVEQAADQPAVNVTAPSQTPQPEKIEDLSDVPDNPFDPDIDAGEAQRRAIEWFSYLKFFITLAAGYLLKFITKKFPNFKFGQYLPAALFSIVFVGFGFGYGWDVPTLFSNVISIGGAILAHTLAINPLEGSIKKAVQSESSTE